MSSPALTSRRVWSSQHPPLLLVTLGSLLAASALMTTPEARADIIHVPSQYATIQYALIRASAGDTVLVAPGTYYENVAWPATQSLHLLSAAGPELTTIDGMGVGSVIRFTASVDSESVIHGFTLTHGEALYGGAIYCPAASPVVSGNHITKNSATYYGAGFYCADGGCRPVIRHNVFRDNIVNDGSGGGICAYSDAFPTITDNQFLSNRADAYYGGAIHCEEASTLGHLIVIARNTFRQNSAGGGGAVSIWNPYSLPPEVHDNEIVDNTARNGGGVFIYWSPAVLTRNIIRENHATRDGGGIYAEESHTLVLQDCDVSDNGAGAMGGGVALEWWSSAPQILGNHISGNTATDGAGICAYYDSSPTIRGNQILHNEASGLGGAVYCARFCAPTLEENVVSGNLAGHVGGMYVSESQPAVSGCVITDNGDVGLLFTTAWADHIPQIHENAISGHATWGVANEDPAITIAAEDNWWGDASGPHHPVLNPGGQGNAVTDYVSFVPWLSDPGGVSVVPEVGVDVARLTCQPNPFRGTTTITYSLPEGAGAGREARARVAVYDVTGRLLRAFPVYGHADGRASVAWEGRDREGNSVPPGVLFVRLEAGSLTRTLRVVHIR